MSRAIALPLSCRAFVRSCMAWRLIQNSALVPKNRASRKAVSAVTERSPLTMALIRVAGTRSAMARAFADMPNGFRNSSPKTSPGWVVTRLGVATPSVVVDNFDMVRTLLGPGEADAPLIVDADRMLAAALALHGFEAVRRRRPQIAEVAGVMKHVQLAPGLF